MESSRRTVLRESGGAAFPSRSSAQWQTLALTVRGAVQGVGFRPYVYRLATSLGLAGYVSNTAQGVSIEVDGTHDHLVRFRRALIEELPAPAVIDSIEAEWRECAGHQCFEIRHSVASGPKSAQVLPDIATCPACLNEVFDPGDRRYRYPFTNCTHCGPRFSIIEAIPYDRVNTSMRAFTMCARCQAEFDDPGDRRFHAQPNACPDCGPHLELWDERRQALARDDAALTRAAAALREGRIVALKGLGGFHLMVDARNECAVSALRTRKRREEKPLALLFPDLESVRRYCVVTALEARVLTSAAAPIVLLQRAQCDQPLAASIAPGNPCLGAMLPYTPLHHLLMRDLGFPIVATSGNRSGDPICIDERSAYDDLSGIADLFLLHDRPIVRPVDDSVTRVMLGRETVLRRARGYAPAPLPSGYENASTLAVGAHLKNTIAVAKGDSIALGQHLGDLETVPALAAFERAAADVETLFELRPSVIACDMHPDYRSTQYARATGLPLVAIQHHHAHVVACMAENGLHGPVLGVSWDGAGYGPDGTTWGGEFLVSTRAAYRRAARLRAFRLPGGDAAAREPRRSALGALYEAIGSEVFSMTEMPCLEGFSQSEQRLLRSALEKNVNVPKTTSAGRLFDAVASIAGIRQRCSFEGQAAMELEWAIDATASDARYPFTLLPDTEEIAVDWAPMLKAILEDVRRGAPTGGIAAGFHNTLGDMIVAVARSAGLHEIVLTGGCFQNKYLLERTAGRLSAEGFQPVWHHRVPPNDGGIAFGQAVSMAARAQAPKEI